MMKHKTTLHETEKSFDKGLSLVTILIIDWYQLKRVMLTSTNTTYIW